MKKIIITESQLEHIKTAKVKYENNSQTVFNREIRRFIYNLINKDVSKISDYWLINGFKRKEVYGYLKKYDIISNDENGDIVVPKKNFDRKVVRLYNELFPTEEPGLLISEDEGGMAVGGATTAMNSGSYETPLFSKPLRRKIGN